MVVDTSVIIAILESERDAKEFAEHINNAPVRLISAVSVLEAGMIAESRKGEAGAKDLDSLLQSAELRIVPFDEEQAAIARSAFRRFGKGRHSAGLNFGDCAAYALSLSSGEPLLFKGDDFAKTDIREYGAQDS